MLLQRVIPDEKLQVPPKAMSVNLHVPILVWSSQSSKCDSPQVHKPLSTDNKRGSSPKSPPKPTHNLVYTKDKEGLSRERSKRTTIKSIRYRDKQHNYQYICINCIYNLSYQPSTCIYSYKICCWPSIYLYVYLYV